MRLPLPDVPFGQDYQNVAGLRRGFSFNHDRFIAIENGEFFTSGDDWAGDCCRIGGHDSDGINGVVKKPYCGGLDKRLLVTERQKDCTDSGC